MLELLVSTACCTGTMMSIDMHIAMALPAADAGTRMHSTNGWLKAENLRYLACTGCECTARALLRVRGRRELSRDAFRFWIPERDVSDPQDRTPRVRSCPVHRARLQQSQGAVSRHHSRRRRGVRSPGRLSWPSRTGGRGSDRRRGNVLQLPVHGKRVAISQLNAKSCYSKSRIGRFGRERVDTLRW